MRISQTYSDEIDRYGRQKWSDEKTANDAQYGDLRRSRFAGLRSVNGQANLRFHIGP